MKKLILLFSVLFTTMSFAQVPNYVPANGLVGWWPFNGNANDESGNGNNGMVNGAMLTNDRFGNSNKAFSFFGSSNCQNITIPNSQQLNPNEITINCWVNALDSNMTIMGKSDPSNASKLSYAITFKDEFQGWKGLKASYGVGNCSFSSQNPAYWSPQNTFPNVTWIMITVKINSNGDIEQYLNSNLVYSVNGNQSFAPCNDPSSTLRIGGPHWNNDPECFKGNIDDIGIWNRALTDCEIQNLYTSTNPTNTTTASACNSYVWNGITYIASGVYTGTTTNCITESLNLTITPSSTNTTLSSACDSYVWNGTTYSASGVYTGTTTNCVTESLNLTINPSTSSSITQTALDSYTWPVNNQSYTTSGAYTAVIPNAAGCDSTITLNLTMSFTGINDISTSIISIYPNPTNGDFTITGLELVGTVSSLILTDMNGKVVKVLDTKATKFSMASIKPGVYFLNIVSGNKQEVLKIVKE